MMQAGRKHAALYAMVIAGALLSLPRTGSAIGTGSGAAAAQDGAAANASAALNKKELRDVHVDVQNGVATLTGQVSVYADKMDAENRVRKAAGVTAVRDQIEVAGKDVPDQELENKLIQKLASDREGYHDLMFNAISVQVNHGMVTLVGHAADYQASDSAMALVAGYPGVKGVVNHIAVDPPSPSDDAIRMATARAIYGFPALNRYAMDPQKPIRISVQMGHVELYGIVDSKADSEAAYARATSVPGVFSVQNNLEVVGQAAQPE